MAKAKEKKITAIIDTREQLPLALGKYMHTVTDTLQHGDYSLIIPDMRRWVCVERKSIADFVMCCGRERARFEKELMALRGYRFSFVICEFSITQLFEQQYRSQISPNAVLASVARWTSLGAQFLFAESHEQACWLVAKYLELIAMDIIKVSKISVGD